MKKRLLSLALCGALLCGALAGCGGNETPATSQEPSSGQTEEESKILTTAVSAELNTLYPLNMDVQNNIGTKLCYEGLVNYENGEVVPCLAESWEFSDDGTALTFHLKEDVTFHDGTPFNAEAVKTDFDFAHSNPNFSNISAVANVESIEVVDEYTVTFHYPTPYFAYLMDFCYPETMVLVSPAVLEEGNYQSMNGVVGTGPYVYEEIVDGDYVRFVRNENYWGEQPYTEGIPAADHVSFHLPQGTVTGLVGPSGGGKSTLAQLLLRFYEPQRGTIRIGGVDIREIPPARLMELVAYVFQDSVLFTDTIENNIRMGNTKATMEEVEQAARNAGIHEVIQALPQGYQTVVGRDDAYLSGGEKQRLAIARVFLKDAPIIILDEATAYADAENEAKIQAAFAKLAQNKTVLMIAHRLKTVERADQILVMDKGKLVGAGTHEELLTGCETYKNLVDANLRRDRWSIGKGAVQV